MKKKLSLMLALVMTVSLFPIVHAEAAYSNLSDAPQYIAEDFEEEFDSSKFAEEPYGNVAWTQEHTHNGSKGALLFTPTNTEWKSVLFPLRTEPDNTYYISAWIKFINTPTTQNMSFVIRNDSKDGTIGTFNQPTAKHTEQFEAGKWVQITAKFTAPGNGIPNTGGTRKECVPNGTIDFRIDTGNTKNGAFVIDDFYVFPVVAPTTDDGVVFSDSFDSAEDMSATWKPTTNYELLQWIEDGADGTKGAMQITKNSSGSWDEAITLDPVNFQFFKNYRLTYWIKAVNDEAVGKQPKYILQYDRDNVTDPNVWTYYTLEEYSDVTLTKEWQKVEFDVWGQTSATEETFPQLRLRLGAGTEPDLSYAVDEISLTRIGGENIDAAIVSGHYSKNTPNAILYQMSTDGIRKTFLYRLYQETSSGDVLLANGQTENGYLSFATSNLPSDLSSLRLDVIVCGPNGNCSEITSCYLKETEQEDSMSMACDQYIWTKDVDTLSATVRYFNDSNPDSITAYVAQYDNAKRLLGVTPAEKSISAREDASWQVSATVFPTAVKAKFFAWYEDSVIPVTYSCEIEKTTSGEFIYVDAESKAATADGSFAAPFKTISAAKEYVKTRLTASTETDIYVILKGGEYTNDYEALRFTTADGATGKNVIYTSLDSNRAKITGAKHILGASFTQHDTSKNIWKVSVPAGTETRQLYVNGIKATRARSKEDAIPFVNQDRHNPTVRGIQGQKPYFNNEAINYNGITTTDLSFLSYSHPEELELYFASQWRHQFICPDGVESSTDENGNPVAHFTFTTEQQKKEWKWLNRDNAPIREVIYVENAYELLDEPGEWYLDTHVSPHVLYYIPREFETLSAADFVIPASTKLMTVTGTPTASGEYTYVQNIAFKNIDFEYTGWNRPTEIRGFRNGQNATFEDTAQNTETMTTTTSVFDADRYSNTGGKMMVGAVEVKHGKNITFDNCDFSKIGSMALKMIGAVQQCYVTGNEFYDIAGSAITLGEVTAVDGKAASGIWYADAEKTQQRLMAAMFTVNNTVVANNYIHKVATEYKEAAAIGAGYPVNTVIRNNDISDGAYCGIHTGWGWDPVHGMTSGFVMEKNYIHNFMNWRLYDGAAIYMLGGTNGEGNIKDYTGDHKNYVRGNYFQDVQNLYGGVYPDEGSNGWWVEDNVIDTSNYPILYGTEDNITTNRWLHIHTSTISAIHTKNNYSTTAVHRNLGTNITYEAPTVPKPGESWPTQAQQIISEAGIEKQYLNRFDFDLQAIRMAPMVEVAAGKTENLVYDGIASKDRGIDLTDYQITMKSSNPAVATATRTAVTGKAAGTAWITMEIVRKDASGNVQFYDEHVFRVVVK